MTSISIMSAVANLNTGETARLSTDDPRGLHHPDAVVNVFSSGVLAQVKGPTALSSKPDELFAEVMSFAYKRNEVNLSHVVKEVQSLAIRAFNDLPQSQRSHEKREAVTTFLKNLTSKEEMDPRALIDTVLKGSKHIFSQDSNDIEQVKALIAGQIVPNYTQLILSIQEVFRTLDVVPNISLPEDRDIWDLAATDPWTNTPTPPNNLRAYLGIPEKAKNPGPSSDPWQLAQEDDPWQVETEDEWAVPQGEDPWQLKKEADPWDVNFEDPKF